MPMRCAQASLRARACAAGALLLALCAARAAQAQEAVWVASPIERAQNWYAAARAALEDEGVLVAEAEPGSGSCSAESARAAAGARGLHLGVCVRPQQERGIVVELIRDDGERASGAAPIGRAGEAYRRAELALALGREGLLRVRSTPAGALVSVDGRPAGHAPFERRFAPGSHELAFELEGFASERRTVELARGSAVELEVQLSRAGRSQAAPRSETSPLNYILGGALALGGGTAFAIGLAALLRDGDCTERAADGGCARRVSFGTRSAVLFGAGVAALAAGGVFLLLAPIEVEASADPSSARLDLRARF